MIPIDTVNSAALEQTSAALEQTRAAMEGVTSTAWAQVAIVAMLSTAALLPIAWLGVRRLVPGRNIVFARWGFSHVALALLILLAASLLVSVTGLAGDSLVLDLALSASTFGCVVAAIGYWAVKLDPDGLRVLGLRSTGIPRALAAASLAYIAAFPGLYGSMRLWHWLLEMFGHVAAPQEVAVRFASLPSDQLVLPLLIGIVVQPLFEEVIFRSFLQPLLVQNFREALGIGITSVVFAALHGPDVFLPIFLLSCLLGAVKLRTQSLYAVWFLHALNNGLTFYVLFSSPEIVGVGAGS